MTSTQPIVGFNARLASISTVTTAAASKNLVTRAVVKSILAIDGGVDDSYLDTMIGWVSAEIANYCNRVFVVEGLTDQFWPAQTFSYSVPGGADLLQLSRFPAVSVTSLTENGEALVADTDYTIDLDKGQILRLDDNGYPAKWAPYPIVVVYSAGYADIPGDIQDAACRMIKARRDARGRDPFLKQQNIPGVLEQQWWVAGPGQTGNMPPDVADILDNYRVPVIG